MFTKNYIGMHHTLIDKNHIYRLRIISIHMFKFSVERRWR